jgi:asparagine synthase (glutamine-hydrolysing)
MCGIVGWIGDSVKESSLPVTRRMLAAMARRGPDGEGEWIDDAAGVWIGHRRLAVIDLSPTGHQPMTSVSGRYVLSYNGEIYNYPALRRDLQDQGVAFRGTSDSETLLALIDRVGIEASLPQLNGMFAFALWDRETRTLWLARDRLGIKPLVYATSGNQIAFASDLSALRPLPWLDDTLDPGAVADYFRYLCVPAPASVIRGARKLPPGGLLRWQDGAIVERRWWRIEDVVANARGQSPQHDLGGAVEELQALLDDAVQGQLVSDVPLGAFLSGGIDSSLVTARMRQHAQTRTFTVGFPGSASDESEAAAATARHLDVKHETIVLAPDEAMALVDDIAHIHDEPFADASSLPTALLCRATRARVTVALAGDGGDELFGGYPRYFHGARIERMRRRLGGGGSRLAATALNAVPPAMGRAFGSLLPGGGGSEGGATRLRRLALYLAHDRKDTYRGAIAAWQEPPLCDPAWRIAETGAVDIDRYADLPWAEAMMAQDQAGYLPDDILTKADRASMAVGLEVRVPLLDHRLVEFSWRLAPALKWGDSAIAGKRILRALLARSLPPALIDRPKKGFGAPLADWLRGPLRPWAEDVLSGDAVRRDGILDPAHAAAAWARFVESGEGFQQVWTAIQWLQWREAWHDAA